MIRPLNDLFTKAVDYCIYRLENRSARYDASSARRINLYRKKLDVPMKTHTFGGQDPIAVLGFLVRFKMACDHNGVSEGAAVWCFQFYLTVQAHALLQSRLHGNTMAVDAEQRELLETYAEVVNFLLRTYATDEVLSEAVDDVTSFRQSSNMTEEVYSNQLWGKALRCGTVFSNRPLKSLFVEGLLPATCAQVRNYLETRPGADYQPVARYAHAISETHRSARRQATSLVSPQVPPDSVRRFTRNARTRPVLSVESLSELPTARGTEAEEILSVTDLSVTPSTLSSPPTSYHPSPALFSAGVPMAPAYQSDARAYPYGRPVQNCSAMCLAGREQSPTVKQKEEKQQQKQPLPMARATERLRLPFSLCGLAATVAQRRRGVRKDARPGRIMVVETCEDLSAGRVWVGLVYGNATADGTKK